MADTLLTEQEIDQIISSIHRVFTKRDIRYLLPPAYKWLVSIGFSSHGRWSGFTEHYVKTNRLLQEFLQRQNKLVDNRIYQSIRQSLKNR